MSHQKSRILIALILIVGAVLYLFLRKDEEAALLTPHKIQSATSSNVVSLPGKESVVGKSKPRPLASSADLEIYLKDQDPQADWRISKSQDGRVISISGGMIHEDLSTPEKYLVFARKIAKKTGVDDQQIQNSSQILEGTQFTEAKQFDQIYEGYQVFGGLMKIFKRNEDGAVYYIANETQNIGEVDLRIKYTSLGVKDQIGNRYADKKGVVIESVSERPVVYVTSPGQGELAWEVVVRIERPLFERRHLLVSAINGNILKDTSMVKK